MSAYPSSQTIACQLTIVALGLLAEPREERLAGEGVSHATRFQK